MNKKHLITAGLAAALLLSQAGISSFAEDTVEEDTGSVSSSISQNAGASQDLSGLIEVTGESSSQKGESLTQAKQEEEDKHPSVTPALPAAPPSGSLTVETCDPYPSPQKAAEEYADEIKKADISYSSDTLFYTCTKELTGSGFYYLTHIVIADPDQIGGLLSYDDLGGERETPLHAAERTGAQILVNGSYFDYGTNYATGGDLLIRDNKVLHGSYSDGYEICLRSDGTLFSPGYNTIDSVLKENVKFSWGTCEDLLIRNGKKMELRDLDWDSALYPRTAVGMVRPLEYYLITAGTTGHAQGITIYEEQEIFSSLGCWYARGLDGGGSSALVIGGAYQNENGDTSDGKTERRPVSDFLAVYDKARTETETESEK